MARAPHLKGIGPLEWYHPFSGHGWVEIEVVAFNWVIVQINIKPKKRSRWAVRVLIGSKVLRRSMYGNPSSYGEPLLMFCRHEPNPLSTSGGWLDVAGRRLWQGCSDVAPWDPTS